MAIISVELRNETGRVESRLLDETLELSKALPEYDNPAYPYLRLVDPYGDTVFSGHQMAAVLPELGRLVSESNSKIVADVLELAYRCSRTPHTYLVFVGD